MKKLILISSATALLALNACSNSGGGGSTPTAQPISVGDQGQSSGPRRDRRPALKDQLAKGRTLVMIFESNSLVSELNKRSGTRNPIALQEGKPIQRDDPKKGYCQLSTGSGYLQTGNRFEVSKDRYQEKVYLGTTRSVFNVSDYLWIQCFKGGFDQDDMTLEDLRSYFGDQVSLEITD